MKKPEFEIEINPRFVRDDTAVGMIGGTVVMIGSTGGHDTGWLARLEIAPATYLQLFPKYGLVAMEINNNGNTNLPAGCVADDLLHHLFNDSGAERVRINAYDDPRTGTRRSKAKMRRAIVAMKECANQYASKWGLNYNDREVNDRDELERGRENRR